MWDLGGAVDHTHAYFKDFHNKNIREGNVSKTNSMNSGVLEMHSSNVI